LDGSIGWIYWMDLLDGSIGWIYRMDGWIRMDDLK